MLGKILSFNNDQGIISGEDGKRYNFNKTNWSSERTIQVGQKVDFEIQDEKAVNIFLDVQTDSKDKLLAGLLAIFLGGFGIHKFYLGCNKAGIIMLLLSIFGFILFMIPTFIIWIISLIEGLIYLMNSNDDFQLKYVDNRKCWF